MKICKRVTKYTVILNEILMRYMTDLMNVLNFLTQESTRQ